jgi:DNA-binding CsgD family transcriptional regulator
MERTLDGPSCGAHTLFGEYPQPAVVLYRYWMPAKGGAMPDLTLQPREQAALRDLFAIEPVAGRPIPPVNAMETIARLIPCDAMGVGLTDNDGYTVDGLSWRHDGTQPQEPGGGGPYYVGVMHWLKHPREAEACFGGLAAVGAADSVVVGFRNGPDHVAQICLTRKASTFSQRDLAMLHLLSPILRKLLRERPTPQLPASLTVQERRILMHVAVGSSNAEIAEALFVAPSTIRKHLEHSYRKLGVTNRVAAVARLHGGDLLNPDVRERIQRVT